MHAADHPADHQGRRHQVRQDRGRHRLAGRRHDVAVRLLPVLDQRRGRVGHLLPQGLHRTASPGGDRRARAVGGRASRSGGRRSGRWRPMSPRWCTGRGDRSGAGGHRGAVRQGRRRALDARTLADATGELPGATVSVGHSARRTRWWRSDWWSRNAARRASARAAPRSTTSRSPTRRRCWRSEDFLHGQVALLRRGRKSLAAGRRSG